LDNIAPLVVGNGKYKEKCKLVLPTSWMMPSSEAFAVLCLENYYDNIQDIVSNNSTIRKPLWTNRGKGSKRNQGWSREGITRFEQYCKAAVERSRSIVTLKKVDTTYWKDQQARRDKEDERNGKREKMREERESGWQVAHRDEWSDDHIGNNTPEIEGPVQQGTKASNDDTNVDNNDTIH
jgi:hypothetical protein